MDIISILVGWPSSMFVLHAGHMYCTQVLCKVAACYSEIILINFMTKTKKGILSPKSTSVCVCCIQIGIHACLNVWGDIVRVCAFLCTHILVEARN